MTRSPLLTTLLALVPLVALAFPLARVLNPPPVVQVEPEGEKVTLLRADAIFRSAHPFDKVTVQGLSLPSGDDLLEIMINPKESIQVSVKWPEGTPETALLVEISADGQDLKTHTIWGVGSAVKELNFDWNLTENGELEE